MVATTGLKGVGTTGIEWVEAMDAAKHPTTQRTAPQQITIQPQMPVQSRLRNPDLDFHFLKLTPGHSTLFLLCLSSNLFFLKRYFFN